MDRQREYNRSPFAGSQRSKAGIIGHARRCLTSIRDGSV
jgi:hypothetical protein